MPTSMETCLQTCLQTRLQTRLRTCLHCVFQNVCTNSMHKSSDACGKGIDRSVHSSVSMLMLYVYSCMTTHENVNLKAPGVPVRPSVSSRTAAMCARRFHPRGDARGRLQRASDIFARSLPQTCLEMCSPTCPERMHKACAQGRCTKRNRL